MEEIDTVVIGGGQAGLSVGHHLARRRRQFVILDAEERIGDVWRKRWDSLRLFSPARYDGLDGLRFPGSQDAFPAKDDMADYLETYAQHFGLPVRSGVKVTRVSRKDGRYLVEAKGLSMVARQVVIATGQYQRAKVPDFAAELSPAIVQLHASHYRNPNQLRAGPVLIVGAGNSGAEIGLELSRTRRVLMAGPDTGEIPFSNTSKLSLLIFTRFLFRIVFHRLLTIRTPMGRRARRKTLNHAVPLIRTKKADLLAAGVKRIGRITQVVGGKPALADGRAVDVESVIWCSGFRTDFSWIDLPIFDADGQPRHRAGVVPGEPGLYFVGLHFLYAMSSSMVHGVGRDADRIAGHINGERPENLDVLAVA
jgi:putative flavoprotein involved in K+ transport